MSHSNHTSSVAAGHNNVFLTTILVILLIVLLSCGYTQCATTTAATAQSNQFNTNDFIVDNFTVKATVGTVDVYGNGRTGFYKSEMTIDADGAYRAYNQNNTGLDYLANAGHPGNWWALVTYAMVVC